MDTKSRMARQVKDGKVGKIDLIKLTKGHGSKKTKIVKVILRVKVGMPTTCPVKKSVLSLYHYPPKEGKTVDIARVGRIFEFVI